MVFAVATVVVVLVLVIAAAFVGRETGKLEHKPAMPSLDVDDAVAWIADHLPADVTAQLSYEDVRRIVEWILQYFRANAASGNGSSDPLSRPVVVSGAEVAEFALERAQSTGTEVTVEQVYAVLDAQIRYLREVGAAQPGDQPGGQAGLA